ncbi:hypothetical protein MHYP_G00018860 [Metynnis hypsauchen]
MELHHSSSGGGTSDPPSASRGGSAAENMSRSEPNANSERTIPVQTSPAQRDPEKTTGDQTSSVQTITAQHGTAVSVYYSNNVFHGAVDTTVRAESKQEGGRATSTKAQHEDSTDTAAQAGSDRVLYSLGGADDERGGKLVEAH